MKTWEESLRQKMGYVHKTSYWEVGQVLDNIEAELERDTPDFESIANMAFRHAAMEDHNDEVAKDRLFELLTKKQHDYGHENIMKHHIGGLKVRMWDKVARLRNLTEVRGNSAAVDESIGETWDDVFGYAVIGMMLLDGTFTLPLAADVQAESIVAVTHADAESYQLYRNTDDTWQVYVREYGRLPRNLFTARKVIFHG